MKINRGLIYLVLAALIYSFMPVLIRFLAAGRLPPISQVFLRYIFAFLAAVVYFGLTGTKANIQKKDLPLLLVVGVLGYGLTNLFFTYGVLLTQISAALFLFYCFGILTPLLGIVFLKERVNRWNLIALALGLVSLAFLFRPTLFTTWKMGALFALAAALAQSVYLVGRKLLGGYSSKAVLLVSTFLGTMTVGFLSLTLERRFYLDGGLALISARTWLLTIIFGFMNFGAWFLMSKGFEAIKATTGGLVLLLENVFAVSFAYLFFAEVPTFSTAMGGLLILLSSVLVITKGDRG